MVLRLAPLTDGNHAMLVEIAMLTVHHLNGVIRARSACCGCSKNSGQPYEIVRYQRQ